MSSFAFIKKRNDLASDYGLEQIERIVDLKVKVDFNQGVDARLITPEIAQLLGWVKWLEPIRLACDSDDMMPVVERAVELLRWNNCTPRTYSCYVLARDYDSTERRLRLLKKLNVDPFVQVYRGIDGTTVNDRALAELARWANIKTMFWTTSFEDFCLYRGTLQAVKGEI